MKYHPDKMSFAEMSLDRTSLILYGHDFPLELPISGTAQSGHHLAAKKRRRRETVTRVCGGI
jgi:hypothetical protein